MRVLTLFVWALSAALASARIARRATSATSGVESLVQRRLPDHADKFEFSIVNASTLSGSEVDTYTVSTAANGKIHVEANTVSALLVGLHRYLSDVANVDIWWYIGSRLDAAKSLPALSKPIEGSSIVPFRYHFNTVTTSYTSAFWSWEDWELQLDWMALRGINMPLAWIGVEKIFIEVFEEAGFTDAEIKTFLSGPAFQAWNHFGNIQGSWGGDLPFSWVDDQFAMQKKIVARMVELGMTPIFPAFPGFVPTAVWRVFPNASVTNSSSWNSFPTANTYDSFLDPFDDVFETLQKSFISKQQAAYGNVSSLYALDQFNENSPASTELEYLKNMSLNTWKTLKAADENAVWVMQAWLFVSDSFWTDSRIEAYLGGVPVDDDLLVLDLFSESQPQWSRLDSYYGKPWVWCQLHDYGHNMGLYGQIENITINPIEALASAASMKGLGLSMEGQEGNEIMYDLLLDQAWSATPIDTPTYFHDWVSRRYEVSSTSDKGAANLYKAWEMVRPTVYNNTNLAGNAVPKAIYELVPSTTGLINRTGHHPTVINYQQATLVEAWNLLYKAGQEEPALFANPAYAYDLVDWTRQVMANAFIPAYQSLIAAYTNTTSSSTRCREARLRHRGAKLTGLLTSLDKVLATNDNFKLSTWIKAARATTSTDGDFLEYEARNQVTLWGPTGQITDYASKSWAGLVSTYYVPRWQKFIDYLVSTSSYSQTTFLASLLPWEESWCNLTSTADESSGESLKTVLADVIKEWPSVFTA